MPTSSADCVNYEINIRMCPCTNEDCDNRGICCECLRNHHAKDALTACMKGAKRDPATMRLSEQAKATCSLNQVSNLEFCVCTYEPCERKGVCCNCVRNHWNVDGSDTTACMRGSG